MRHVWLLAVALSAAGGPLAAQQEPPMVETLRRQVMERFVEAYRTQAGLTLEQDRRFTEIVGRSFAERRDFERQERALWMALEGQMRPGVAADADSVTSLLDGLTALQQGRLDQARREQEAYAQFLTPIQRAQLTLMWERLRRQVDQVIQRRMQGRQGPPGGPPPMR